jgi:hypothetical protein
VDAPSLIRFPPLLPLQPAPGFPYSQATSVRLFQTAERSVTGLVLVFLLIFAAVTAFFWAFTLWFQGYIYSVPAEQLPWRAPVAGLVLTLFLAFWCWLDYRRPGTYGPFHQVAPPSDQVRYQRFWAVRNGKETLYAAHRTPRGQYEYRDNQDRVWRRSDANGLTQAIIVEDPDGEKVRFNAELTPDGKFKTTSSGTARYVEEGGRHRVMTDDGIGAITTVHTSLIAANLLLNAIFLAVWFVCLWLLLRFQWGHALGLAVVFWLAMTLAILPMLFTRVETASRERGATPTAPSSAVGAHQVLARMCMMSPSLTR